MNVVDVLGSVDVLADGMGGSVDAVTGAAIGPYRKSRLIQLKNMIPRAAHVEIDSVWGHAVCCEGDPEATKIMSREISALLSRLRQERRLAIRT